MTRRLALLVAVGLAAGVGTVPGGGPRAAGDGPALDPDGFRLAVAPYRFEFPRDHASHPAFRTEWWYYTGHLRGGSRSFGYELTFFRVGLARPGAQRGSAWAARDVVFAHLALTDESRNRFRFADDAARPALGMAGADTSRYRVWLHGWSAGLESSGVAHRLTARTPAFGLDLSLVSRKPPVIHGEGGVSQKSPGAGQASHYASLTRLETRGHVFDGADSVAVDGLSWMDHEFGSSRLSDSHAGWDWFSIQLDDGRELMLYQLRMKDGGIEPLSSGTWVDANGAARHLRRAEFRIRSTGTWKSPASGATYPQGWTIELPREGITLRASATVRDQELVARSMGGVTYWEGSVRVTGTHRGRPVAGVGYVELTGYTGASPF